MIRFTDAFTLAHTKLRTRKVRTIITATIASLLFSLLVAAILVISGVIGSARNFMEGGLTERYLTSAVVMPAGIDGMDEMSSREIIARAQEIHKQLIADKTAEAKRLGIEYDPKSEPSPVNEIGVAERNLVGERYLDESSAAARQALAEYHQSRPSDIEAIRKIAEPFKPKAVYQTEFSALNGRATHMEDGQESFGDDEQNQDQDPYASSGLESGWVYMDQGVTDGFLLPQAKAANFATGEAIPLIAPYDKVEKSLGLKKLPNNASQKERLARISEVRSKASDVVFEICYRNSSSEMLIEQAKRTQSEIAKNQNNPNYKKPNLVYGLPEASSCGPAVVESDTRTQGEKDEAAKLDEFESKFNKDYIPDQQKLTFKVVGIAPSGPEYSNFSTVDGIVSMVAGQSLQGLWVVPSQLYDKLPNKAQLDKFKTSSQSHTMPAYVGQLVEFKSSGDAKRFIDDTTCLDIDCDSHTYAYHFGSNSALTDEISRGSQQVLKVAGLIIASIAAVIMMGMVGRVMSDSRRETAVFRAIGARRGDISLIYLTYTTLFCLVIAALALALGMAIAGWVDSEWSSQATVSAQLAFAGAKDGEVFRLIGFSWSALLAVIGLIVATGLVGVLVPLMRNVRRSPLRDMRDDQ